MLLLDRFFARWRKPVEALPLAVASPPKAPTIKFPTYSNLPPELQAWADQMAMAHGPTCGVWTRRVDWITALAIVRYGEAPDKWPADLGQDDIERALSWTSGVRVPQAVLWYNKHHGGLA